MRKSGRGGTDRGQDLVEYALVLPVLMLLLLGIAEFGVAVFRYNTVANAAREGARYGVIHPDDEAGIESAVLRLTKGLDPALLTITIDHPSEGRISVRVVYEHHLITAPIIEAFGGNAAIRLETVASMRTE